MSRSIPKVGFVSLGCPKALVDSERVLTQLQKSPFLIFQLDGTAYPGNSGSPLYDPDTGVVYGIINSVLVKGLKETAITSPSGITYAIPASHIRDLLDRKAN